MRSDSLLWNFTVLGEAAARLSDELKERFPDVPWLRPGRLPYCGSNQEAGPPPVEAVGQPVLIDGPQARDVIVDVVDIQRD